MIFFSNNDIDKKNPLVYGNIKEVMGYRIGRIEEGAINRVMDDLATTANGFMKERYPDDFSSHNIRGFFSYEESEVRLILVIRERIMAGAAG